MLMKIFRKRSKVIIVLLVALFLGIGGLATREASANGDGCYPCIDLVKTGPTSAEPGDTITYEFRVRNCGNVRLVPVDVYDPMLQVAPIWTGDLDPDETATFSWTYTVPEDMCGELSNTANAVGVPDESLLPYCEHDPDPTDTDGHTALIACDSTCPGTGTPGYWKNHPEAWPVSSIMIGGVTYTKEDAIAIMQTAGSGDKTYTMFKALVAAKLNVLLGCDSSCIDSFITLADAWMAEYGPVGSNVRGSSHAWSVGEYLYHKLDKYNNGRLCAPSRD